MPLSTSLIATVLNEADNIGAWLDSVLAQTRRPDEIIVVDGGSTDNTASIMRRYEQRLPLRIIVMQGCNISQGRNIAIARATGDILAISDAGVRMHPEWMAQLAGALEHDPAAGVACGFFVADAQTPFELALGATTLPQVDEVDADTFLPSSRSVALRRELAQQVAGYPQWLDYCEDLIFDMRLKQSGARFVFVPEAIVYFRPRPDWYSYFRQYYRYARGDGKVDLWRRRHRIRYATYLVALPLLLLAGGRIDRRLWLLLLPASLLYLRRPLLRVPTLVSHFHHSRAVHGEAVNRVELLGYVFAMVPLLRAWGDLAKMLGYPVGVLWRRRHRPPQADVTLARRGGKVSATTQ